MNARKAVQWIVVVFVLVLGVGGVSLPVFAGPVHLYGGDFDISITDKSWMNDAIIKIPDYFIIYDIDVHISLTHSNVFDLQVFLQSPAGTKVCLNVYNPFDEFFEGENYTKTIFDDEAKIQIKQASAPFTGRFRPVEPYELSVFDGEGAYGTWCLQIYDAFWWDTGSLNSFELAITTPEPDTVMFLALGAGLIALFKPRRDH